MVNARQQRASRVAHACGTVHATMEKAAGRGVVSRVVVIGCVIMRPVKTARTVSSIVAASWANTVGKVGAWGLAAAMGNVTL